jgi:cytoskeletal protein CcmA (bactofilin family)
VADDEETAPAELSARAVAASTGELNALLGRGTRFEGKLTFEGRVRIDGHFTGEVFSEGVLVVGEEAELTVTALDVGTLIVRGGTVRGDITARAVVEVYAPATVLGNISSPEVFIDKGVRFEGGVKMPAREH